MTQTSPPIIGSEHAESVPSLNERLAERVMKARLAIESDSVPGPSDTPDDRKLTAEQREIRSLKRVFRDLGYAYRRYRSETGGPVAPGLRDATDSFRNNPSFPALVGVAAILEDLKLL
ncbi:MAG TPA: hypothetical protein VD930_04460, partial [Gemmatimonadales bacterium]|nr:hypothetical protein [Gemmatimonadales bacterium]